MKSATYNFSNTRYHTSQDFYADLWQKYRKQEVLRLIGYSAGKVLDIGCYDGTYMLAIKEQGNDVYGIDASEEAIAKAKAKGLQVMVGDLETAWKLKDKFFDAAYSGEVLEHIIDTDFFISEAHRVLKIGGKLIITTPNLATLSKRLMLLLGKNPWQEASFTFPAGAAGHLREFTPGLLRDFVESKGFVCKSFMSDIVSIPFCPKFLQRFLARVFPGLGRSLIMSFERKS